MANIKNQKDWDPNWDEKWCTPKDLESPDDDVVCTCWNVTVGDIKEQVSQGCCKEDIKNITGLGSSCEMCVNRFEYLVDNLKDK